MTGAMTENNGHICHCLEYEWKRDIVSNLGIVQYKSYCIMQRTTMTPIIPSITSTELSISPLPPFVFIYGRVVDMSMDMDSLSVLSCPSHLNPGQLESIGSGWRTAEN